MNPVEKEHLLHKVVAASAFVFALSILPLSQYFLVINRIPAGEQGKVAGVSTDASITHTQADIPVASSSPALTGQACETQKQQELAQLDAWMDNDKKGLQSKFQKEIDPYQKAIPLIQGSDDYIHTQTDALNRLISDADQIYRQKVADAQSAVDSQKKSIDARSCLAE